MWNSRVIHYNLAGYANLAALRNRVEWVRHLLSSSNEKGGKGSSYAFSSPEAPSCGKSGKKGTKWCLRVKNNPYPV
jgi:hypothetical protein